MFFMRVHFLLSLSFISLVSQFAVGGDDIFTLKLLSAGRDITYTGECCMITGCMFHSVEYRESLALLGESVNDQSHRAHLLQLCKSRISYCRNVSSQLII